MKTLVGLLATLTILAMLIVPAFAQPNSNVVWAEPIIEYVGGESEDSCINCQRIQVGFIVYNNAQITHYPHKFITRLPLWVQAEGLKFEDFAQSDCVDITWTNQGDAWIGSGSLICDHGSYSYFRVEYSPLQYGNHEGQTIFSSFEYEYHVKEEISITVGPRPIHLKSYLPLLL